MMTQNGNAHEDGIGAFWTPVKAYRRTGADAERRALTAGLTPESTQWQYTNGVLGDRLDRVSPDTWTHDQALLDQPSKEEIMLDLFYDYRTNVRPASAMVGLDARPPPPTLAI